MKQLLALRHSRTMGSSVPYSNMDEVTTRKKKIQRVSDLRRQIKSLNM
jgi:hypothetical protein